MKRISKTWLIQKHIRLAKDNINFLDNYILEHDQINNYSEAIREMLLSREINNLSTKLKLNAMGKDVSIILVMLKNNDEEKYLEAKQQVEAKIKKRVTRRANATIPRTKSKPKAETKDIPEKLDLSFLGLDK